MKILHKSVTVKVRYLLSFWKAMLSCSESAIFLCDKNKIGKIGVPRISGLDGIDCFITDAQLTDEWQVALAEQDVKLVEVEK